MNCNVVNFTFTDKLLGGVIQPKINTMEITKENLINHFGMFETEGDEKIMFPLKKVISIISDEDVEEDEGELAICITRMRNKAELCLSMPDGSVLYLAPKTIEDLQAFERCIESFEPVY